MVRYSKTKHNLHILKLYHVTFQDSILNGTCVGTIWRIHTAAMLGLLIRATVWRSCSLQRHNRHTLKSSMLIKMLLVGQIQYYQPHLHHKISKLIKEYCEYRYSS